MIAKVLVDVPAKAVDKLFDYRVPELFRPLSRLACGLRFLLARASYKAFA